MLEAKKKRWFEEIFARYNRNLFKRRFHALNVSGIENLAGKTLPQVIYANHSSWWDGLVAFEIARRADSDSFMMMEEKQLRKLFLFRYLGAFSVVREAPREAVKSINYAARLLHETKARTLWIFPQGEILPNDVRPLKFYRGVARVIEKIGAVDAVPLALRYEFRGEFKPQIFVKIGAPQRVSTAENFAAKNLNAQFQTRLTALLDEVKNDILGGDLQNYENILT